MLCLLCPSGEGEEVHAAAGQPEAEGCGEGLHVQQTRLCHLQHGAKVRAEEPSEVELWVGNVIGRL